MTQKKSKIALKNIDFRGIFRLGTKKIEKNVTRVIHRYTMLVQNAFGKLFPGFQDPALNLRFL
jgi:hypothetical protein